MTSKHEGGGQEEPRLSIQSGPTPQFANKNASGKEMLSTEVPTIPGTNNYTSLQTFLQQWLTTPDWSASKSYLQTHLVLLTDQAEQVLATLRQSQLDMRLRAEMQLHGQILHQARQRGVEDAYQQLLDGRRQSGHNLNKLEEIAEHLREWVATPDWETSRIYLQEHPFLLTDLAEQVLERLKTGQSRENARTLATIHQALLREARQQGIAAAYETLSGLRQPVTSGDYERDNLIRQLIKSIKTPQQEQSQGSQAQKMAAITRLQQDPVFLNEAGLAAIRQYHSRGQIEDLHRALECWQKALVLIPPDSPDRSMHLSNLGLGLHERYQRTGSLEDLDAAISAFQQTLQTAPSDYPNLQGFLSNLGLGLHERYRRTGTLEDLDAAISAFQQAVQDTPPGAPGFAIFQSNLGAGLYDRYMRARDMQDLNAAISAFQQAVQDISLGTLNRSTLLSNLGGGLRDRYQRTGNLEDLERAIIALNQAVDAAPFDASDRPLYLNNLALGLFDRYRRTGVREDLETAIIAFQQAVQTTARDATNRSRYLNNLGLALHARYAQSGILNDLDQAISSFQQAVDTKSNNAPDRLVYLSNLGGGLCDRYDRTGDMADLEAAISLFRQAVQTVPSNSPIHPALLTNLAATLDKRYERTGRLEDLEASISARQHAVDTTLADAPDYSSRLSNLGTGLRKRFAHTRVLKDLEAAITAYQQALDATPANSPDHSALLNNLGTGLSELYRHTRKLADLEAAVAIYRQAVNATQSDAPDRFMTLGNLGSGLLDRYKYTGALTDLEAANATLQQAVNATPPDAPNRFALLASLGNGFHERYKLTRVLDDLNQALSAWQSSWSSLLLRYSALPVAYQIGQQRQRVMISSLLVTGHLERSARYPSSALLDRRSAFEVAESDKSRLLSQLVGRGPLPPPGALSPEVAAREQQLLTELTVLDTLEMASQGRKGTEQVEDLNFLYQRQKLLQQLEELWSVLAQVGPEEANYVELRRGDALTWNNFAHLAKDLGPATVLLSLFTTANQVLLFLLRATWRAPRVVEVPLDQLGWTDLLERFFREVYLSAPGLLRNQTWEQPLRPLLAQAQRHLVGAERLILAPAGLGHLLPWGVLAERTGWQTPTGQPLPLVTLPALGVLPRLRQRPRIPTGPALVIGNPRGDLLYAEAEARMVAERFGASALLRTDATKATVLPRLREATLIHLATHAFFDPQNPLESGIVLADGILTAREVLEYHLQADLLVLSACESGQVASLGGEELAGLSQAFLLAGVRSLLVSLWQVNDPATAALMQAFYTARQLGVDKALALRQAMTQIQQDPRWTHPHYWGAFVLIGDWD